MFYGSAGKSGMYFVEDNVAETLDNQVCAFSKRQEVYPVLCNSRNVFHEQI